MPRLAIVWTRPETVRDDALRALAMIDFEPAPGDETAVLAGPDTDGCGPGRSTAPWHVAAALAAVQAGGGDASTSWLTPRTRVALHLPVASLHADLGVACCLRALASLRGRDPGKDRSSIAWLDAAGEALDAGREHVFLVDATLVPGGPSVEAPLRPRNLLLAGRDPVALDTAVARLSGLDPASIPLLAGAASAGLGAWDLNRIELVGDRDDLLARPCVRWHPESRGPMGLGLLRTLRRLITRDRNTDMKTSPWHALWRQESVEPNSFPEAPPHA